MRGRGFFLAVTLIAGPAAAQLTPVPQSTDITHIAGTIPTICSVEAVSSTVQVQLSGQAQDITDVIYTCNSAEGITRRISSLNSGRLLRGLQGIPYLISQDGNTDLAFAPVSLSGPVVTDLPPSEALTNGTTGLLRLSIPTIPQGLVAGEYVDTVTIEIVPN